MNSKKILENFNQKCSDCGIQLVRQSEELICPKCGMVEESIEGAE
jgi:uncharacterized Zn finger protein (UPF0148 family)